MKGHIEALTGYRPDTCPWRVFYDPLVAEVIRVASLAEKGLGLAALGSSPLGIVIEALPVYFRSYNATRSHDLDLERKQREAQTRPPRKR